MKEAAFLVMDYFKEEFSNLDEKEQKFVSCFHDILFDVYESREERIDEEFFSSAYYFPRTLKSMAEAMEFYHNIHNMLSTIQHWSTFHVDD